jgi:oligoribonuclease NrnB/cAMP/cGMP phosphodiesterase (DHH superfamily)
MEIFCQKVLDIHSKKEFEADYHPTFFRDKFIPESKEALAEYNKWNKFVSETDWYKKTVKKGERRGLKF